MLPLDDILKPTLLIDENRSKNNIKRMEEKANASGATLRPHFKTHQSATIAQWYREYGVTCCTASSVSMAQYFAAHGWDDITIAFPYNPRESKAIDALASSCRINVFIESVEALKMAIDALSNTVGFFIKMDVGTHRTGVNPDNGTLIEALIACAEGSKMVFKGFAAHAGHTYVADTGKVESIYRESVDILSILKSTYGGLISYGDTPSCSLASRFDKIDEVRPGNFVFYDVMMESFGVCGTQDISACLAAPVVALHPERNEVVTYSGAVNLSKDYIIEGGQKCYGKVVALDETGWQAEIIGHVIRLSQEHGVIQPVSDSFDRFQIGGLVGILPVHSCLAADLQGSYLSTAGQVLSKIKK